MRRTYLRGLIWEWGGVTFRLDGEYEPGTPCRFSGHPDTWEPGEAPMFVIDRAFIGNVDATDFLQSVYTRDGRNLYDVACEELAHAIYMDDERPLRRAA